MFESLSKKLLKTLDYIRGKDKLSESDVENALREIKIALLEADVSLNVVKDLMIRLLVKRLSKMFYLLNKWLKLLMTNWYLCWVKKMSL